MADGSPAAKCGSLKRRRLGMYDQIKQVIVDSGIWDQEKENKYGFVLSPSVYEVSEEKKSELEALSAALHDCMAGLGRIAAIAFNPTLTHSGTWRMIVKALHTGIPAIYHDIMLLNPSAVPSICKVDMMESEDGKYFIAEIDGHNKHGLGYSTLAARIRGVINPEAKTFPGVAALIAKEIKRRGENVIALIYSDQERFYLPEFRILKDELMRHDVGTIVAAESEVQVEGDMLIIKGIPMNYRLFVDFPFLYFNRALNNFLAERYKAGEIDFLIPPKPFLGSKVVLALLRNDTNNPELEAILRSQIKSSSLELLRRYIPETYLVHRRGRHAKTGEEYWRSFCDNKKFVLKESISSGMKGTIFMDDWNGSDFDLVMERACSSYFRFVMQKEVTNRPRRFEYFEDAGNIRQAEWFMRVTVHFAMRRVADIVVTARQDKRVHGALDCLQLGTIIV